MLSLEERLVNIYTTNSKVTSEIAKQSYAKISPVLQGDCLMCVFSVSSVCRLFETLRAIACQAPLSVGFSRQEYWSGLPCPPPVDQTSHLLCLMHWRRFLYQLSHLGKPQPYIIRLENVVLQTGPQLIICKKKKQSLSCFLKVASLLIIGCQHHKQRALKL